MPSSSAARSQSRFTDASSPTVAQPSSAARIASHISSVGTDDEIGAEVDHVSPQQVAPGTGARVLAAVDDEGAVDEHVLDTPCVVVRVVDRRDLVEAVVVEDDDVGGVARAQEAPIPEAEVGGGHARHLADRLLEAERAVLPHVVREVVDVAGVAERMAEDVCERPFGRDGEGVDAEAEERVRDHLGHVLVGEEPADDEDALVRRAGVGEHVEEAVPGIGLAQVGDLGEREAVPVRVLLARLQAHAIPLALVDEPPVAVALGAQPVPGSRDRGACATAASAPSAATQGGRIPESWPSPSTKGVVSASTSMPSSRAAAIISTARSQPRSGAPVLWRTFRCEISARAPPARATSRNSAIACRMPESRLRTWLV